MHSRDIRVRHVCHERNATRREAPFRFFRARHLAARLWRKYTPHVAEIDTDLLEDLAAHEARFTATLQAMALRLAPLALLEAAVRFKLLERRANAALQVAEILTRGCGHID